MTTPTRWWWRVVTHADMYSKRPPRGFAIASYDFARDVMILAPWPLAFIVRAWHWLWFGLVHRWFPIDAQNAYERGLRDGRTAEAINRDLMALSCPHCAPHRHIQPPTP